MYGGYFSFIIFFFARGQLGKELVRMKRLYIEGGNGKGVGEGDEVGGDRGGMTAAAKRITAMKTGYQRPVGGVCTVSSPSG